MSFTPLLKNLGYAYDGKKDIPSINHCIENLTIKTIVENQKYKVSKDDDNHWFIETKIILNETDLQKVASIATLYAPLFTTVYLQADTHQAGDIYVGMIMTFNDTFIPINLVSGDIGCGLSVISLVKNNKHMNISDYNGNELEFHTYVLTAMRNSLRRGTEANKGTTSILGDLLIKAIQFYENIELYVWLNEMEYVLKQCNIQYKDKIEETYNGLTKVQSNVLRYIGKYAQTLGSSGNHFMELSTDDNGYYWIVVHSGSRGLGAKVYDSVEHACKYINNGYSVATGELAIFYTKCYDALNKFAKLNRIVCAMAVLKEINFEYDSNVLIESMSNSYLFEPALLACDYDKSSILSLISGLTHNGIKAFVNNQTKEVLYALSKGAVAMTKRASSSIVALRAGEGCYLWTLVDMNCNWKECNVSEAVNKRYTTIYQSNDIIFSGHGAGRSKSSGITAATSTFEDVMKFYDEHNIAGNLATGVLSDNPQHAYNSVDEIIKHLPLDIACTKSMLKTRVSFKEGLLFSKKYETMLYTYIKSNWNLADDNHKLMYDINTCYRFVDESDRLLYQSTIQQIYNNRKEMFS